jgi:hypothetical protein
VNHAPKAAVELRVVGGSPYSFPVKDLLTKIKTISPSAGGSV